METVEKSSVTCPFCAEEIKPEAIVCKHCGKDLDSITARIRRQKLEDQAKREAKKRPKIDQSRTGRVKCSCGHTFFVPFDEHDVTTYKCPVCGKTNKRQLTTNEKIFAVVATIIIFAVSLVIFVVFIKPGPDTAGELDAYVAAQYFVERSLKSPSSADFGDYKVSDLGNGRFLVTGDVDAANSFGAMIRNKYYVSLRYKGNDKWALEGFSMD